MFWTLFGSSIDKALGLHVMQAQSFQFPHGRFLVLVRAREDDVDCLLSVHTRSTPCRMPFIEKLLLLGGERVQRWWEREGTNLKGPPICRLSWLTVLVVLDPPLRQQQRIDVNRPRARESLFPRMMIVRLVCLFRPSGLLRAPICQSFWRPLTLKAVILGLIMALDARHFLSSLTSAFF